MLSDALTKCIKFLVEHKKVVSENEGYVMTVHT